MGTYSIQWQNTENYIFGQVYKHFAATVAVHWEGVTSQRRVTPVGLTISGDGGNTNKKGKRGIEAEKIFC